MADAKDQHEPSMEEILASIRRIIAEDGEADGDKGDAKVATASPAKAEEEDVLELTDVLEEDPPVANTPEAPAAPDDETPFTLDPGMARAEPAAPAPPPAEARLISTESATASVAALAQLVNRPREKSDEMPLGHADRTLEDLVRELLRPILKTWLDDHLPSLVERLVQDEIARLVRDAQGH
jgi:cell pole-organizing protein PopZ